MTFHSQSDYSKKLLDPRWQRKRLEILDRDGFQCRSCGARDRTLHVHHRYYEYGRDPWDYDSKILVTLCDECHEGESIYRDAGTILTRTIHEAGFLGVDILDFCEAFQKLEVSESHSIISSAIRDLFSDSAAMAKIIGRHKRALEKAKERRINRTVPERDQCE
jgi:hypothetical protein